MSATVVDASAIAAVLFDEPEAAPIVASVADKLIAPTLLRYELASVCTTKSIRHPDRAEGILARYRLLDKLAIDYIEPDWDHLPFWHVAGRCPPTTPRTVSSPLARHASLVTLDARLAAAWMMQRWNQGGHVLPRAWCRRARPPGTPT